MACLIGIGLTAKSGANLAQPFPSVKKDALVKKVFSPSPLPKGHETLTLPLTGREILDFLRSGQKSLAGKTLLV
jgi:hypothetical protein